MSQHLGLEDPLPEDLEENGLLLNPDGLLLEKTAVLHADEQNHDSTSSVFVCKDNRVSASSVFASKLASEAPAA